MLRVPFIANAFNTPAISTPVFNTRAVADRSLFVAAFFVSVMVTSVFFFLTFSPKAAADTVEYRIDNLKDNVWRFTAGPYRSAFMVTDEGIFLTDPVSTEAAQWLKTELGKRFEQPVRYMAYSHSHPDHVQGGQVLDSDSVTVIAHELADEDIRMTRIPTALPELTFPDDLIIRLGDSQVELQYHGTNNGRGNVSMRFMPANVMYVVDWIVIGRMPYKNLMGYDINGMIHSTRDIVNAEPFDLFIGGHADTGTQEDVEAYLRYLETLYAAVRDGMLEGKNLETLQQEIRLTDYSHLRMYDEWLPYNIEGIYNTLLTMSYFNFREDTSGEL